MVLCNGSRVSHICSLTAQRGKSGRVGITSEKVKYQHPDIILAYGMCKANGIGMTVNDCLIRRISESKKEFGEMEGERERKETEAIVKRADCYVANMKMMSTKEDERREGRKLLERCAKEGDGYALFCLGLMNEMGFNGIKKDPKAAKEYYEKSAEAGFSDAALLSSSIITEKKLNTEDEEWYPYFFRLQMAKPFATEMNLSGLIKMSNKAYTAEGKKQ